MLPNTSLKRKVHLIVLNAEESSQGEKYEDQSC